ncbi:MAG: DNA polymerase-4 [Brevundimonas sp.]
MLFTYVSILLGRGISDRPVRKIIHVDMDAFFASVEQRDDPALRGRPVAVGYAAQRGVVAAASYEARVFGLRSAMPSTTALRQCPDLVFVPPRFEVYRAVSKQIQAIFADYTPLVEPLSLDEAYLDVTDNLRGLPTASETAVEIRAPILEETGLTASAGISYNKFLAKLAPDQRKPNGQFVVPPGRGEAFVEILPVKRFYGVGPVTAAKMNRLGIETGEDLRRQSLAFLQQHFGKSGPWYYAISRGVDHRAVNPNRERKSSGSETTFGSDLTDPSAIEARCPRHGGRCLGRVREVGRLRAHGDGEGQMCRLSAVHPQPFLSGAGDVHGSAGRDQPPAGPLALSARQGHPPGRRQPVQLQGAGAVGVRPARLGLMRVQADLIGEPVAAGPAAPDRFRYWPDLLSEDEQARVLRAPQALSFKPYIWKACAKLGVRTRIQAVAVGVRTGIIDPEDE